MKSCAGNRRCRPSSAPRRARSNSAASPCPPTRKILLLLAAANRDPRRWEDPEKFDVTRKASGHVAFGGGIHMCVGQMLARLESEMILAALLSSASRGSTSSASRSASSTTPCDNSASIPIELTPV